MTADNISRRLSGIDHLGKTIELSQNDLLDRNEPLIILGDAGMGKSTLLEWMGRVDRYQYVNARRLIRARDPRQILGSAKTLVIDALDELATQTEGGAVDAVLAALEQAQSPNFVIACRLADWRSATGSQAIADSYGCDPLELVLEPITRLEARNLLALGLGEEQADAVIEHFEENRLEDLFGNPQTLQLIGAVAGEQVLPDTRAALFELSAKRLWAEHSKKKPQTPLSKTNEERALDAAGSAFSALILSGKRALSRLPALDVEEDDLPIAEVAALSPDGDLTAVLESRLFSGNIEGSSDRFSYIHRSVGEFLAARWLAGRANTDRKRRRLLKLFHAMKLVPSSLRGVHAWLARDPHLASAVIRHDPMGLVEYGDTDVLSEEHARSLLGALFDLGQRDPRRYHDFNTRHSMRGIVKPSLCEEIRDLITSQTAPFALRSMLLHAIKGSSIAPMLERTLEGLLLNPQATFHERSLAGDALTALPSGTVQWPSVFAELHDFADKDSLRLAIELLPEVEFRGPSDRQVVELIMAASGLSLCALPRSKRTRLSGLFWRFSRTFPDGRLEAVLDDIAYYSAELIGKNFDRFDNSDVVDVAMTLIARRLKLGDVEPLRLWRWLSPFQEYKGFHKGPQEEISTWLRKNTNTRRSIQRFALLDEIGPKDVWERGWRLNNQVPALYPDEEDLIELLLCLEHDDIEASGDRWRHLVRLCPHDENRGQSVRDAAAAFALTSDDRDWLHRLGKPEVPEWQIKEAKREKERKAKRDATWKKHRADFAQKMKEMRSGKYGCIVGPAQAYLNLYSDIGDDMPAHERIEQWLGPELQEAAFQGFDAFLTDENSKPTAREIASSYAENKHWHAAYIFVAAVAERVRNNKPLDDLPSERLIAALLEIRQTQVLHHARVEGVGRAIEESLRQRADQWEEFWRLRIEPQLTVRREHVDGLYEIARSDEDSDLAVKLALDWLERFPEISRQAEVELVDCLISSNALNKLENFIGDRVNNDHLDNERLSCWDAVAFLVNFEKHQKRLEEVRGSDGDFLWHLRARLGQRSNERRPTHLSPSQIGWIVKNYRNSWPYVSHPLGSTTGDTNSWDATEYLLLLIDRLGGLTTAGAIKELTLLRDAPVDSYTDYLKRIHAEQAQKVVEESYQPHSLSEIAAILNDGPPTSMDQLQAVMLEELDVAQAKIRGHPVDWYRDFYENGSPRDEEACRDALLKVLGDYPSGVQCEPEGHLADDKRADIRCTVAALMLPIEVKGQWHKDLWHAADTQLDRLYGNDWRAERLGIYVVLWFGENAAAGKRLKSPGKGQERPKTAEALRSALVERSEAARQGRIEVVVLDLTRP